MKSTFYSYAIALMLFSCIATPYWGITQQNYRGNNFVTLKPGSSESEIIKTAANVTPSARQLTWQRLETTAFVHFGTNTFYNQEWGMGTEDPARFNPTQLNTDQWAKTISEAGFKMLIMTCKHHDGLCLWPSKYTKHSIASSPWQNGKGDVVKMVSESCRKYKLKFGIYLSPWDRHEPTYGNSPEYNKFFLNQLTELLTNYGTVDEVWFDGACGEGPNGKKQVYDWEAYYSLIRKLQPNAVIAVMGPDVRWVGTESGYGRETEWSVVPFSLTDKNNIADNSQQQVLKDGFTPPGDMEKLDLGSREIIKDANTLIWYPSEVDVSIRPGWFWHGSENGRVKTPEKLLDIYFSSVGRNSVLLLNIPPDSLGLINEADCKALKSWNNAIQSIFKYNLATGGNLTLNDKTISLSAIVDNSDTTSLNLETEGTVRLELDLKRKSVFDVLLLQENISVGQRIEHFVLDAWINNTWQKVTEGTTVGYKRLLRFPSVESDKVRLTIDQSRLFPSLAEFGLYKQLPEVKANPQSATFTKSVQVELTGSEKDLKIYYATDGSVPDVNSLVYSKPLLFNKSTTINFLAIRNDGTTGFLRTSMYMKARNGIKLVNSPDPKYTGGGPLGLVDGVHGSMDFSDGRWSGFNGSDLLAFVDLGRMTKLKTFDIHFLESTKSWIFRPKYVEFAISDDNLTFKTIFTKSFDSVQKDNEEIISVPFTYPCKARYIKVRAVNYGKLPVWHSGKNEPAWLFVDEITVN